MEKNMAKEAREYIIGAPKNEILILFFLYGAFTNGKSASIKTFCKKYAGQVGIDENVLRGVVNNLSRRDYVEKQNDHTGQIHLFHISEKGRNVMRWLHGIPNA